MRPELDWLIGQPATIALFERLAWEGLQALYGQRDQLGAQLRCEPDLAPEIEADLRELDVRLGKAEAKWETIHSLLVETGELRDNVRVVRARFPWMFQMRNERNYWK